MVKKCLTDFGDGGMVADLFQVVVPSVATRAGRPGRVGPQSVAQDRLVVDVVGRATVVGGRTTQHRIRHQRNADLSPIIKSNQ